MEKLSCDVERSIHKWSSLIAFVGIRGCFFTRLMDLACFFGVAGSNNDVNILDQSSIF